MLGAEVPAHREADRAPRPEPVEHHDRQELRRQAGGLRPLEEPAELVAADELLRGHAGLHLSGDRAEPALRRQGRHLESGLHHLRVGRPQAAVSEQQLPDAGEKGNPHSRLLKKIVDNDLEINFENYSRELQDLIRGCLTTNPQLRPNILQVANLSPGHKQNFAAAAGPARTVLAQGAPDLAKPAGSVHVIYKFT